MNSEESKTCLIECAWNSSCGFTVLRDIKLTKSGVKISYSRCNKCQKFTAQDINGKIIKYESNEKATN